jgi:hypothetical protein
LDAQRFRVLELTGPTETAARYSFMLRPPSRYSV